MLGTDVRKPSNKNTVQWHYVQQSHTH